MVEYILQLFIDAVKANSVLFVVYRLMLDDM